MAERMVFTVVYHDEGSDGLWAEVRELPGLFVSGDTRAELVEALEEAIGLYLSGSGRDVSVRLEHTDGPTEPPPVTVIRKPAATAEQRTVFEKVAAVG